MLNINTNSHDRPYFTQQPNAIAPSIFSANNDLLDGSIAPLNVSGNGAESALTYLTASSTDEQTLIADFIAANSGNKLSFSAGDRVTGDVTDSQVKPL